MAKGKKSSRLPPGVKLLADGRYEVRARVRTVRAKGESVKTFEKGSPLHEVLAWLAKAKEQILRGLPSAASTPRSYAGFWRSVLARRSQMVEQGKRLIKSEKNRETWEDTHALVERYLAECRVDQVDAITKDVVMGLGPWLSAQTYDPSRKRGLDRHGNPKPPSSKLVAGTRLAYVDAARRAPVNAVVVVTKGLGITVTVDGEERRISKSAVILESIQPPDVPRLARRPYSSAFKNIVLRNFRTVMSEAVEQFDLPKNPCRRMGFFPDKKVKGNALRDDALRHRFEKKWLAMYGQSYALFILGCHIGGRKSTLYPIRRSGPDRDWNPETGELVLRRSLVTKQTPNDEIKTVEPLTYGLSPEVNEWLKWHVRTNLETKEQQDSDLLFPAEDGRFRHPTFLDKHFANVSAAIGGERFTSKAMRRTAEQVMARGGFTAEERRHHMGWTSDAGVETQERYGDQDPMVLKARSAKVVDLFKTRPPPMPEAKKARR